MSKKTWKIRASCIALALALPPLAAKAQSSGPQFPYRVSTDSNGVNFPTGQVVLNGPTLSIGATNGSHLDFNVTAYSGQIHNSATQNYFMSITTTNSNFSNIPNPSYAYVSLGEVQENFKSIGGSNSFISTSSDGSRLSINYNSATYTAQDGTAIGFGRPSWMSNGVKQYCNSQTGNGSQNCYSFSGVNVGGVYFDYLPTIITKPNGEVLKLFYEFRYIPLNGSSTGSIQLHLLSVKSSSGLELRFDYASNFSSISKVYGINNAVETCANDAAYPTDWPSIPVPSSDVCSLSIKSWPSLSFSTNYSVASQNQPYYLSISNSNSETTTFNFDGNNNITSFANPSGATTYYKYINSALTTANSSDYQVSSVKRSSNSSSDTGVNFTYNFSYITDALSPYFSLTKGNPIVAEISNANGVVRNVVADNLTGVIVSDEDAYGNKTVYKEGDLYGHIAKVTKPDQSYDEFSYDSRGNLKSQVSTPAPGSGLAAITKSAVYDDTCDNVVKCNQPNLTTDGLGHETDYTYDATTGLLTSITGPADSNSIRPQVRYSYTAMQGYYINSPSGARGFSGQNTYLLTATSMCRSTTGAALSGEAGKGPFSLSGSASCAGGADETTVTTNYGAQTAETNNNLWPVSQAIAAGDGSVTSTTSQTYDNVGNVVTSVGPLGTAQTTVSYYDATRRLTGQVAPDPDGAGSRVPAAVKYTYNANGLLAQTQTGTVPDQSGDSFKNSFTEASRTTMIYDAQGRPVRQSVVSGAATYGVSDQLYDSLGRPYCQIQYMDMANVPSSPASSCAPYQTGGIYGADRVTQNGYDNDDRVIQQAKGSGTSAASVEKQDYTANGALKYQLDANSNATNYTYDGFGRLSVTSYPATTAGVGTSGVSSTSETLGYDANDNVVSRTQRDGSVIAHSYDALNRPITRSENGTETRKFGYDLQGRLTSASWSGGGSAESMAYDALGNLRQRVEPYTTMSYDYDGAGNRKRVTWADGFAASYNYDETNNVLDIKENFNNNSLRLAQYGYDSLGRRTSITFANGASRTYAYDPIGRLAGLQLSFPNSTYNQTIGGVNGVGAPIAWTPSSQMASIARSNDAYLWTGAFNLSRTYKANELNQYTSSGGVTLSYDLKGNLVSSGSSTFSYDTLNRVSSWANSLYPDGIAMAYGALDELQGYGGTGFAYDGANINGEYSIASGGATTMLHRYVYGPGSDEPIVWYIGSDTSQRRFLQADERGSIVAVTDASGDMIATNTYDEFGIPGDDNVGRFQYTGQTWFGELGLYNYKARWYSPSLGRFVQTDPIGYDDGLNWYNYAHGDPVNGADPTGLVDTIYGTGTAGTSSSQGGGSSSIWNGISWIGSLFGNLFGSGQTLKHAATYSVTAAKPQSVTIDETCSGVMGLDEGNVQRSALSLMNNLNYEQGFFVSRSSLLDSFRVGPKFTSYDHRDIKGDLIEKHQGWNFLDSVTSGYLAPYLFIHSHPNNPPPSRPGSGDRKAAKYFGVRVAAIDRSGRISCTPQ